MYPLLHFALNFKFGIRNKKLVISIKVASLVHQYGNHQTVSCQLFPFSHTIVLANMLLMKMQISLGLSGVTQYRLELRVGALMISLPSSYQDH